jgi:hypothetical protein
VHARPVLWIEKFAVERWVGAHLRILFGGPNLIVDLEDDFRRHPPTAETLVFVELSFLRLCPILSGRPQHAHEIKLLLVDPKLRRMHVALFRSDDIDRSALPIVFTQYRKIKL